MASRSKPLVRRVALAAFAVTTAWLPPARADDVLDRNVPFHISASPLASALIEFSTQSGLQLAAADADVAHLNSNGVNGTIADSRGVEHVASRHGPRVLARWRRNRGDSQRVHRAARGQRVRWRAARRYHRRGRRRPTLTLISSASPEIPEVTVMAPRPPTDAELAGDSLYEFIVHHATTHYVDTGTKSNLARWRGGTQSICPKTVGLDRRNTTPSSRRDCARWPHTLARPCSRIRNARTTCG